MLAAGEGILAIKQEQPYQALLYVGTCKESGDPAKPVWRVYRETVAGGVRTQEFANFGKFVSTWTNRATYFSAPPADTPLAASDVLSSYMLDAYGKPMTPATEATQAANLAQLKLLAALLAAGPLPVTAKRVSNVTVPNAPTPAVLVSAANPARKGFLLWNNSANSAYVTFAAVGGAATPDLIIPTFTQYVWAFPLAYTGPIVAARNAGTGTMVFTEFI